MQAAAALAVKDLAANERQEIALQERRKHADGKAKKYRKSLKEVGIFLDLFQRSKFTSMIGWGRKENRSLHHRGYLR